MTAQHHQDSRSGAGSPTAIRPIRQFFFRALSVTCTPTARRRLAAESRALTSLGGIASAMARTMAGFGSGDGGSRGDGLWGSRAPALRCRAVRPGRYLEGNELGSHGKAVVA